MTMQERSLGVEVLIWQCGPMAGEGGESETDWASIFQSHSHSYKYKYSSLGQQHVDKPYANLTYRGTAVLKRTNDEQHARWGHFQPRHKKWGSNVLIMREEKLTRKVDRCLHKVTRVEGKTLHSPSFIGSYSCNLAPQHDRTQYNSTEMLSSVRNLDRQLTSTLFSWTLGQINLQCTWTKDLTSCSVLVNLYVSWPENEEQNLER